MARRYHEQRTPSVGGFTRAQSELWKGERLEGHTRVDGSRRILVTLTKPTEVFPLYQHTGIEIIYMLEGRMEYGTGTARYLLGPGDALQFEGEVPHGPADLLELPVRFLSVKAFGTSNSDRATPGSRHGSSG